uniref:Uncharacterized protein n=1 Tax=Oryza meridionalis TaxID=40149 RepID=A0A0E0F5K6_9ORYZ
MASPMLLPWMSSSQVAPPPSPLLRFDGHHGTTYGTYGDSSDTVDGGWEGDGGDGGRAKGMCGALEGGNVEGEESLDAAGDGEGVSAAKDVEEFEAKMWAPREEAE